MEIPVSLLVHIGLVPLAFTVGTNEQVQQAVKNTVQLVAPVEISPYIPDLPPAPKTAGGGGGDRSPLPASKGWLPRADLKQFTPPTALVQNQNPRLVMEPTIIADPNMPLRNVNMPNSGDPFGQVGPPSTDPGSRSGVSAPVPIYKVKPEYSEEARKAKCQGTVVLEIVVDKTGKVTNVRVIRPLGMGLDEKAIEAVSKWHFRPGYKDGKPVPTLAHVEMNFRLTAAPLRAQDGGFAAECRRYAEPVWRKTLGHPFLNALSDGTLPREKFRFYLEQDLLYLREFSRLLLELAAKAPHPDAAHTLARHAGEATAEEAALHGSILGLRGPESGDRSFRMAPSSTAYVNHLKAAVGRGSFLEGMAAVLPCYWVYMDAGKALAAEGSPEKEYQQWILQYAGAGYEKSVREALEIFNAAAERAAPEVRARAMESFERSVRYEWMFWEMAWRMEAWPPQ